MAKFDWEKFYIELEKGNPAKFPFWIFWVHECTNAVSGIVTGIAMAIIILIIAFTASPLVASSIAKNKAVIEIFCQNYEQTKQ